jgi:uncharacterized protein YbaP (TraB family)
MFNTQFNKFDTMENQKLCYSVTDSCNSSLGWHPQVTAVGPTLSKTESFSSEIFKAKPPTGFIWRLLGESAVTHYLIGTCHDARTAMMAHPGITEALRDDRTFYTEAGLDPKIVSGFCDRYAINAGFDLHMDAAIVREALQKGSAVHRLDRKCDEDEVVRNLRENPALRKTTDGLLPVFATVWSQADEKWALQLQEQLATPFLCFERNEEWLKVLIPALKKAPASVVIAVGYLHTIGPKGLLARLHQEGFQSERISGEEAVV